MSSEQNDTLNNFTRLNILDRAIKAVPQVKYALGVVGVGAAGSLVFLMLGSGPLTHTIAGFGVMLVFMILLLIFVRLVGSKSNHLIRVGIGLLYSLAGLTIATLALSFTSYFFGRPLPWQPNHPGPGDTAHVPDLAFIQRTLNMDSPGIVGNIRAGVQHCYKLIPGEDAVPMDRCDRDDCPTGYVAMGGQDSHHPELDNPIDDKEHQYEKKKDGKEYGFWFCARQDLKNETFYVGAILYGWGWGYEVTENNIRKIGGRRIWGDECWKKQRLGSLSGPDGFWVCLK